MDYQSFLNKLKDPLKLRSTRKVGPKRMAVLVQDLTVQEVHEKMKEFNVQGCSSISEQDCVDCKTQLGWLIAAKSAFNNIYEYEKKKQKFKVSGLQDEVSGLQAEVSGLKFRVTEQEHFITYQETVIKGAGYMGPAQPNIAPVLPANPPAGLGDPIANPPNYGVDTALTSQVKKDECEWKTA